jgi:hypothetical protein
MRQQDETPVTLPGLIKSGRRFPETKRQQDKSPVAALMEKRPKSVAAAGRPARRTLRIEVLCSQDEKDSILRRAGKLPLGRWARTVLLGRRTPTAEAIPVHKVIGFAETVERLALEGDLQRVLDAARSVQRHLRTTGS